MVFDGGITLLNVDPVHSAERRFGWFTLLTDCPHCGQPLPLNTPGTQFACASCAQDVVVPEVLWQRVLEAFDEAHAKMDVGQPIRGSLSEHGYQVRYEYSLGFPACEKCGVAYPVHELSEGPARDFSCVSCGDPASTAPALAWLVLLVPTAKRIYSTDPGLGQERGGALILPASSEAIRPVSMSCPQCGGALQVTAESKRILVCKYCQGEIYLPDALWRRLHPTKTVQRFFVAFEGLSRAQEQRVWEASQRVLARELEATQLKERADTAQTWRDEEIATKSARVALAPKAQHKLSARIEFLVMLAGLSLVLWPLFFFVGVPVETAPELNWCFLGGGSLSTVAGIQSIRHPDGLVVSDGYSSRPMSPTGVLLYGGVMIVFGIVVSVYGVVLGAVL